MNFLPELDLSLYENETKTDGVTPSEENFNRIRHLTGGSVPNQNFENIMKSLFKINFKSDVEIERSLAQFMIKPIFQNF
jgi:hypothetical protein